MPNVASYVGGDITAGVLVSQMHKQDAVSLFIDIGTNGEIVLGNKEWLVTAACSAGPAFEGSGIKFGMRAMEGAIEEVEIDPKTYEVNYQVIGDVKPIGICGSGMIDILAEMYLTGVIDQKGKIREEIRSKRIRRGENGLEYVIAWRVESAINKEIVLTEVDLDNLIRAKARHLRRLRHAALAHGHDLRRRRQALHRRRVRTVHRRGARHHHRHAARPARGQVPVPRQHVHHGRLLRRCCATGCATRPRRSRGG